MGATGDAYAEMGNLKEAAEYYEKAYKKSNNDLTAPVYMMKAGQVYENTGEYQKAVDTYKLLQRDYIKTSEGRQIEKYITRASLELEKNSTTKK